MADGVQITFRGDISDVVKKAQQIPGEVDRATRKGRRSWEGGPESGSRDQYRKMSGMADEAEQQDAARKKREQDQANKDYLKRLKWNSRIQEDQDRAAQKEADRAAKAADWVNVFGKALESRLMGAIGPAAVAMKAIELGWGSVIDRIKTMYSIGEAKLESGIQFTSTRGLEMFGKAGTLESEDAISFAKNAQSRVNAIAASGSGANAYGFQYFGMTDFQRYRQEGVDMIELIIAMAKRYKAEGGTEAYRTAAENVLGSDWRKISALLYMQANPDKAKQALVGYAPGTWKGSAMDTIEQAGGYLQQSAIAKTFKFAAMQAMQGELMGGMKGTPNQMLSSVTSLQAMGGGDILSAIARGPQDRIAVATEQTAQNTSVLAGQVKVPSAGWFPSAPTSLKKY